MGQPVQSNPGNSTGQPVVATGSIANWTEDDLTNFIQKHLEKLPPQTLTPFLHASRLRVGPEGLHLEGPIHYRGMVAPSVVSAGESGANFQNGWADADPTYQSKAPVQFVKDPFGWVHLSGAMVGSTYGVNVTILQLPPGYRPDIPVYFAIHTFDRTNNNYSTAPLMIDASGQVQFPITGTDTREIMLNGVKYPVHSSNALN